MDVIFHGADLVVLSGFKHSGKINLPFNFKKRPNVQATGLLAGSSDVFFKYGSRFKNLYG